MTLVNACLHGRDAGPESESAHDLHLIQRGKIPHPILTSRDRYGEAGGLGGVVSGPDLQMRTASALVSASHHGRNFASVVY